MHLLLSAERRTPDRVRDYRHPIHHHRQGPIDGHGENSSRHFLLNLRERERERWILEGVPAHDNRSFIFIGEVGERRGTVEGGGGHAVRPQRLHRER
jgi:hypothetical protein